MSYYLATPVALTGRAALLAAVGVAFVALVMPSALGVLVWLLVLVAVGAVDLALAGSPSALRIERGRVGPVRLGEQTTSILTVTNAHPRARRARGLLRDAWQPSAGQLTPRHPLDVPAGQERVVSSRLRPTRRGDLRTDRVTVRCLGPLGVAARQRSREVPGTVRVVPPFTSRKHLPSRLARLRELDGRTALLVRGQGTEFDSLRDYVDGDDVRSIDWRATARRNDLVVRTWRPERDRHVQLVIDSGRLSAGRIGDGTRLDHAMDAALLLGALAARAGDRTGLLITDTTVRADVPAVAGPRVLPAFTDAMAPVQPRLTETDPAGLVSATVLRIRHRALVVLLTGLDAGWSSPAALAALAPLLARHLVVLAAVSDPAVAALERGDAPVAEGADARAAFDTVGVYAAASAARDRVDREQTAATLRRAGVVVVDAPPDLIAPRLADTYLALKAAGRL